MDIKVGDIVEVIGSESIPKFFLGKFGIVTSFLFGKAMVEFEQRTETAGSLSHTVIPTDLRKLPTERFEMLNKKGLLVWLYNLPEHFGRRDLKMLIDEIELGTFDYKCPECGGTGEREMNHDPRHVEPCDCVIDWKEEAVTNARGKEQYINLLIHQHEKTVAYYAKVGKLLTDSVYNAIRHYQKQGLCENNEYDELDAAITIIAEMREKRGLE